MTKRETTAVVRHEEELSVEKEPVVVGTIRARKSVDTETVDEVFPRDVERADVERTDALEGDSGEIETLPDGSVSIPVFEEELVVSKRLVVRERIVIRKQTLTEHDRVQAELRKERVELEGGTE